MPEVSWWTQTQHDLNSTALAAIGVKKNALRKIIIKIFFTLGI